MENKARSVYVGKLKLKRDTKYQSTSALGDPDTTTRYGSSCKISFLDIYKRGRFAPFSYFAEILQLKTKGTPVANGKNEKS
jgi:hypothetical protein